MRGSLGGRRSRAIISVIISLSWGLVALAEPVRLPQVQKVTQTFLRGRVAPTGTRARASIRAQGTGLNAAGFREIRAEDGTLLAYVADLEPQGFLVLSADTDIAPVVAHSFTTSFPLGSDRAHPLARLVREDMRLRAKALAEHTEFKRPETATAWDLYASGGTEDGNDTPFQQWPPEGTTSTGGWLETTWDQEAPCNALCPLDPGDGVRTYVGCVATAFAQLVHYHRVCEVTFGASDAYMGYNGMQIDSDADLYDFPSFAELNDHLARIRLKYSQGIDLNDVDIAALNLACGFAIEMDYGSDGSGASTYDVQTALLDRFGYYSADMLGGLFGNALTILQENIVDGLPALLSFSPPDGWGGHVVVCDGYNTDGEYHLNFGWGTAHPQAMAEAWYRLPTALLYRDCVISECVVNIRATQPALEVDSSTLDFHAAPGGQSDSHILRLTNNVANLLVDSVTCTDGFVLARTGQEYGRDAGSFVIERRQGATIYVRFDPQQAGGYYGTLEIRYGNGNIKRVILRGWAYEGGTTVIPGEVSGAWSREKSPYFVTGNIHIPQGGRLTVEPGVKVLFAGSYGLTVGRGATLLAAGTAAEPIEFTALNREAGWGGLRFVESGADDLLQYCSISWAKKGTELVSHDAAPSTPSADTCGGAVFCAASDPVIENCRITNNTGDTGGAMYCVESWPILSNTLIANNASLGGTTQCGGICCEESGLLEIRNCTIVNNFPGGLFCNSWDGLNVTNTILWGNDRYQVQTRECMPAITFCDVQGSYQGEGNFDGDPCFLDPAEGVGVACDGANWALKSSSPCINAGTEIDDLPEVDLAGGDRVHSDFLDLGAYENRSDLPLITAVPARTFDAGFTPVNTMTTAAFEIVNTGALGFEVQEVLVDDPNAVFSVVAPVQDLPLVPGDSVPVEVAFGPRQEKAYTATLTVVSTSSNAPSLQIALTGVGIAGTIVPGGSVDGVWRKADSPYTVTGDIRIPRSRTLTIEPGVAVKFAGHYSLTVGYRATLQATGTPQDPIVFTATDTEEGWFGIRFVNSGADDVLRHCTLEYAKKPRAGAGGFENLYGGAILCHGSWDEEPGTPLATSPTIDSCRLARNHASTGGAIMCYNGSRAIITNNVIVDNVADIDGGGLALYYSDGAITNNLIARNNALVGGGLMNWMGIPSIRNNTIVANRPSAMLLDSTTSYAFAMETVPIENNIIWQNEIWMSEEVVPGEYAIYFNDIQGGWDGEGNIDMDPLFANPDDGDYHLKSRVGRWDPAAGQWMVDEITSPCIDAGDPAASFTNEPQPSGERINLGAYGGTEQASKSLPDPNAP